MTPHSLGLLAMLTASAVWGLAPLFFHALRHVPPGEVLAHRTLWSLLLFAGILAAQGRMRQLPGALASPVLGRIGLASVTISVNWFIYIWAVQNGHVVQASLGYYMFPLVAVLIGVAIYGERLSRLQGWAVALAAFAVALLAWGLGVAPWLSLALAGTFALYGAVKRGLDLSSVTSVAAEVTLLAPFAVLWLVLRPEGGTSAFGSDAMTTVLLVASGAQTALPLMLFSFATKRVHMTTVGLMQYISPTLQFLCATVLLGEAVTTWHVVAFALIWTALALYSAGVLAGWRHRAIRSLEP